MIIEGLCNIFFALAGFVVSLLPKFPSFAGLNVSIQPLIYAFQTINSFISIKLIGSCMLILLVIYNLKFLWSILMWLIRKIPGVS